MRLPRKYVLFHRPDKSSAFSLALDRAGYEQVVSPSDADFIIIDYERKEALSAIAKTEIPVFIVPHSASHDLLWDGLKQSVKVNRNYVFGPGQRAVMWSYGYKYPIGLCGWPWSNVSEFRKYTDIKRILFAPKHPNGNGSMTGIDRKLNEKTYLTLRQSGLPLTVRFSGNLIDNGLPCDDDVLYERSDLRLGSSITSIKRSSVSVVVAVDTFAYMAVALGKPTLFFDLEQVPHTLNKNVATWELYRTIRTYPKSLFSGPVDKVLSDILVESEEVNYWKSRFIYKRFSPSEWVENLW